MMEARVKGRKCDAQGREIGTYYDNPIVNSQVYKVEFQDGTVKEYAANVIADNIYSQVDQEGFMYTMFDSILDFRTDDSAVTHKDKYVTTKRGQHRLRKTTVGWKLLVLWKNGTQQWIPLKDMKESHPVDVAEFAVATGIDTEPAFCWWVPYTLRKRDAILAAVRLRARKRTHKYGIELPYTAEEALELDKKNGNDFWEKAIAKEMRNNAIAFQILESDENVPVGWTLQSGHMVFDIKMDLTRKARWVLDGHKTPDIDGSTFAGVVSRESVRIALTYAALNDLEVCAGDILNAYLQASSSQQHYIICGAEFGIENIGKKALIKRALYGGKTAGKDFTDYLRCCMRHLNFESCLSDPDLWIRPATKNDGTMYYEYVLLYVDDCLVIS